MMPKDATAQEIATAIAILQTSQRRIQNSNRKEEDAVAEVVAEQEEVTMNPRDLRHPMEPTYSPWFHSRYKRLHIVVAEVGEGVGVGGEA